MNPTVKLYDQDAYMTEFDAVVISCEAIKKDDKDIYEVILDQTAFFPEEGGQSPDFGTIDEVSVIDVQIKKEGDSETIVHYADAPFAIGASVHGVINWKHRFSNMQQHTAEHIYCGIVHERFGYDNVGFHLSDQIVTMDFNGPLTDEEVTDVEMAVNEAIVANVPVTGYYPSKEELELIDYRSKKEIDGPLRIVTIEDYDSCACCAPHVKRTGEIGMFKVMSAQKYKGGMRISFLCGFRALEAFREKSAVISELMGSLSSPQEKLVENTERLKDNITTLKYKVNEMMQKSLEDEIASIDPSAENVILFTSGVDNKIMTGKVNDLMEQHPGICAMFSSDDEAGYQFVVGSKNHNCREIATQMREKLQARGGGSEKMIQGSLKARKEEIEGLLKG